MSQAASSEVFSQKERAPQPRTPRIGFQGVPKKWLANSAASSHIVNGVNLLFPAGERFFVRAVRHYLPQLKDDAELSARVRGFFGQEGRHAQAHERFFDTLREQGYDIDAILGPYEAFAFGQVERLSPPALRLAVTVACEHFTALLAEDALTDEVLKHAHPALRQLLEWHAVEELEHKSVAFDVLRAVNDSYLLRVGGLLLATALLGGFWMQATKKLMEQDGLSLSDCREELWALKKNEGKPGEPDVPKPIFFRVFARGIWSYLKPSFHPSDTNHDHLVEQTLARLTAEGVVDGMPVTAV